MKIEQIYSSINQNHFFSFSENEKFNSLELLFHLLLKNFGQMGYFYFQKSAKYLEYTSFLFKYFSSNFLGNNQIINLEDFKKYTSKKFVKIIFENFARRSSSRGSNRLEKIESTKID